jgi:hypothetical protein
MKEKSSNKDIREASVDLLRAEDPYSTIRSQQRWADRYF